jgi:hypothetical protein
MLVSHVASHLSNEPVRLSRMTLMETTMILINTILILLWQLRVSLDPRNLWTLSAMMALLLKGKRLHLYELARALPGNSAVESRAQKLRRWVSNPRISPGLFVPIWIRLLAPLLSQRETITLIIDRTDWITCGEHLNLLFCSLAFFGRSFPVNWLLLPTAGCSDLTAQQTVLQPVLEALQAHPRLASLPRRAVADREFGSPLLAEWLRRVWHCHYALRLKCSVIVARTDIPPIPLRTMFAPLEPGQYYFFPDITITDCHQYHSRLFIYWRADCDEPLALMTDLERASVAADTYRERPFIETLHRDVKSGGYDIEGSRLIDRDRLRNLLIPAAFAYIITVIQGRLEELRDPLPPLQSRRFSLFSQGKQRFADLIERQFFPKVSHFFRQFVQFLLRMVHCPPTENVLQAFTLFAQQQLLLL